MFQQRWAKYVSLYVGLFRLASGLVIAILAIFRPKMGHIRFVIFGPNVAFTTWASLGSRLFCPGQKNAYSAGSLPQVAHIRMLSGWCTCCCVSFCHTQSKEKRNRIAVTLLLVFKNAGFDSCVGRLMTLPATTLLTNQRPAVC